MIPMLFRDFGGPRVRIFALDGFSSKLILTQVPLVEAGTLTQRKIMFFNGLLLIFAHKLCDYQIRLSLSFSVLWHNSHLGTELERFAITDVLAVDRQSCKYDERNRHRAKLFNHFPLGGLTSHSS